MTDLSGEKYFPLPRFEPVTFQHRFSSSYCTAVPFIDNWDLFGSLTFSLIGIKVKFVSWWIGLTNKEEFFMPAYEPLTVGFQKAADMLELI